MAAWKLCLHDGGVSERFTHKMAACEFWLQDGGVSEGFTPKDDGVEVLPTRLQNVKKT